MIPGTSVTKPVDRTNNSLKGFISKEIFLKKRPSLAVSLVCMSVMLMATEGALAQNAPTSFTKTSPSTKNVLVELFTSDGCDSCPPANHWISEVVKKGDSKIVPVSMHVTYWNNLGWKDPASNPYFDQKQDLYTRLGLARFSYTPAVFLGASEWSGWRSNDLQKITAITQQPAPVGIEVKADVTDANTVRVEIQVTATSNTPVAKLSQARQFVYLVEDGLIDKPSAGELNGVTLRHDHVVKAWDERIVNGFPNKTSVQLDIPKGTDTRKLGIVAYVQSRDGHEIYQVIDLSLQ